MNKGVCLIRSVATSLLFIFSAQCFAEMYINGQPTKESPWAKSKGGLYAAMYLTDNAKAAYESWAEKPRPDYEPRIATINTAKRGDLVSAIILISGYETNSTSGCNVVVDYEVLNPDGSSYGKVPGMPVCTNSAASPGFSISESSLDFSIEPSDQTGEYKINALVNDNLDGTQITLQQTLWVGDK